MTTASTALRHHSHPAPGGTRQALIGLLVLLAALCSAGTLATTTAANAHQDDAHVAASAEYRRQRYSHRLRRRGTHPVRRQARRRSRCLAHSSRPGDHRPRRLAPALGPPDRRGPPAP